MILASLDGTAEISASPAPPLAVAVQITSEAAPIFTCDIDGSVASMARPRSVPGSSPMVGLRVYLDRALIPSAMWLEAWEVNLANAPLNKWSLTATVPSPFGAPTTFLGASPGARRIDITGLYLTSTGLHEVPLVSNGIVDNEQRSQQADGTMLVTIVGTDAWGRFDHRLIEMNLPPFHGLARGDVIARAAVLAGWGNLALAPGSPMDKAVVVANGNFGSAMQPIADVEGWALCMDRYGDLVNPFVQYDGARRVDLVLRDEDIQLGTITFQVPGDVYTRVTLTGNAEVEVDTSIRVVVDPPQVSFSVYAPKAAAYVQDTADGSLIPTGIAPPVARLQMTGMVVTMTVYRGQTVLQTRSVTSGFYNPQVARYVQGTDGTVTYAPGGGTAGPIYLYAGAAAFDNAPAYHLPQEIFTVIAREETTYVYDDGALTGNTGYLVRTVTKKDLPRIVQAAVKTRSSVADAWESTAFIGGRLLLGSRQGMDNSALSGTVQAWLEYTPARSNPADPSQPVNAVEVTTVDTLVDPQGYKSKDVTVNEAYIVGDGALFLFSDQKTYAAETESLQESTRTETSYAAKPGDSAHSETTLTFVQGVLLIQDGPKGASGYLPAATKDQSFVPSDAEFPNAIPAALLQSMPIAAQYISWPLEGERQMAEDVSANSYAGSVYELQRLAMWQILRDAAATASFTCAPNFLLDPGHRITLQFRTFDLLGDGSHRAIDVQNLQLKHARQAGQVPVTTVTGKVHLATA